MHLAQIEFRPKATHVEFQIRYVWAAPAMAIFAGFAIGAHLTFVIGYDFQLGAGFISLIQVHGHDQLVGWVGLFVIGISLHFIPRLAGVPIIYPKWTRWILWPITSVLILRSVGHSIYTVYRRFSKTRALTKF